ncbi:MAG: cobyric acid synthase [Oscillospiraceae bacterium]|nr:cobyric acid synthase [Oscillospiraceae bacterium]
MAKPIMVQGTTSNAGKSVLCAALCRIFHQDGLRVAPFKSQNMALNSYITEEGLEMGRAQVTQAQAAGVTPSVRMNPILLKPTTDVGSQVIVNGVSRGNFSAKDYFRMKQSLIPDILAAYQSLSTENDVVVIEGAGSPAEINLKQNDIVNMGLAALVDAPVLLVADIDPGGVFASLYGTVALLEPEERARIKGLIINKFRGDVSILEPGLRQIEALTGVPVVGVVPYLDLDLDDEDSLAQRFQRSDQGCEVDVAVIRLPRLSNFTDFNPLARMEKVSLRYVRSAAELGAPDLIILPGTKSTISDLRWLKSTGLAGAICRHAAAGGSAIGICGGYQMLGKRVSDPEGAESGGAEDGLGLLNQETVFWSEKARTRVTGRVTGASGIFATLEGEAFRGYEIHMGRTEGREAPFAKLDSGGADGAARGNVWGSYVHGIFDRGDFAAKLVNCLLTAKGLKPTARSGDWNAWQENQLDKLADAVRRALDMDLIYQLIEQEKPR